LQCAQRKIKCDHELLLRHSNALAKSPNVWAGEDDADRSNVLIRKSVLTLVALDIFLSRRVNLGAVDAADSKAEFFLRKLLDRRGMTDCTPRGTSTQYCERVAPWPCGRYVCRKALFPG
jgi:hypothetical protein